MFPRADVDLAAPILLSERGPGASESMIFTGIASAADVLRYSDGTDEVTDEARADTAAQLRGVPIVSPEDHQGWLEATSAGKPYTLTPLGTVIEADQDESGAVRFSAAVHGADPIQKIRSKRWPAVSVGYVAKYGASNRADRAQQRRYVNHLALVPRGRDPLALVRADGADSMPTLAEMDAAEAIKMIVEALMAATKTEMEPLIDGCLAKRMDAAKPAIAEIKPDEAMGAMKAEMDAAKADAAAQKSRADAAEAELATFRQAKVRADADNLDRVIKRDGIQIEGWNAATATAADISKAERAILDRTMTSARADGADPWRPGSTRIDGKPTDKTGDAPRVVAF